MFNIYPRHGPLTYMLLAVVRQNSGLGSNCPRKHVWGRLKHDLDTHVYMCTSGHNCDTLTYKGGEVSIDLHMSKELLDPVGQPPLSHCRRFGGHWTFRLSGMVMLSLNM